MHIHNAIYHSKHEGNFEFERKDGAPDYLFLYFKTPVLVCVGEETYTCREPSAILFSNYTPHKYVSLSSEYYDDFIHFEADEEEEFLRELHFPLNTPIKTSNDMCISDAIKDICLEWKNGTEFSMQIQHHLMMALFWRLAEEWRSQNVVHPELPYYEKMQDIHEAIQKNPGRNWRIQEMADQVSLSPAYFQVLYKKAIGMTCMTDVIQTKISAAKVYLSSTDMSVAAIAAELGYSQVYHFIRQFKKYTGLTPGAFRKTVQNN